MSLRARIFIYISLGLLFVLGISLLLIYFSKNKTANTNSPATGSTGQTNQNPTTGQTGEQLGNIQLPATASPSGTPVKPLTAQEEGQNLAKQTAKIFIERYNTYSTDNGYINIISIQPLTTESLYKKLSARLKTPATGPFVGVTTQVFSSVINNFTPPSAEVTAQATKTTEKGGVITKTQPSYKVVLQASGGLWLVDSFTEVK